MKRLHAARPQGTMGRLLFCPRNCCGSQYPVLPAEGAPLICLSLRLCTYLQGVSGDQGQPCQALSGAAAPDTAHNLGLAGQVFWQSKVDMACHWPSRAGEGQGRRTGFDVVGMASCSLVQLQVVRQQHASVDTFFCRKSLSVFLLSMSSISASILSCKCQFNIAHGQELLTVCDSDGNSAAHSTDTLGLSSALVLSS